MPSCPLPSPSGGHPLTPAVPKGKSTPSPSCQCPSAMSGQRQQARSCQLGWGGGWRKGFAFCQIPTRGGLLESGGEGKKDRESGEPPRVSMDQGGAGQVLSSASQLKAGDAPALPLPLVVLRTWPGPFQLQHSGSVSGGRVEADRETRLLPLAPDKCPVGERTILFVLWDLIRVPSQLPLGSSVV